MRPHQLSGGQQQRVALARAFAIEPRVLLLDEPLSALDAQVRVQLREEIRRVQYDMGTTTILVTHDQEEALSMADRVAVMRAGQVEQVGTPHEVYHRPATAFVSSFVGVVNRIPGRVTGRDQISVLSDHLALSTAEHTVGDVVDVLVRPEHLRVQRSEGETGAGVGVVTALTLRGAISSLAVHFREPLHTIRVDLPSREAQQFATGDRVTVAAHADDALVDTPGAVALESATAPARRFAA